MRNERIAAARLAATISEGAAEAEEASWTLAEGPLPRWLPECPCCGEMAQAAELGDDLCEVCAQGLAEAGGEGHLLSRPVLSREERRRAMGRRLVPGSRVALLRAGAKWAARAGAGS